MVGRRLRRQSFDLNDARLFNFEYADALGVSFAFAAKPRNCARVLSVNPDRDALRIVFSREGLPRDPAKQAAHLLFSLRRTLPDQPPHDG